MASLANMKSQLTELENRKDKLEEEIRKASQRLRLSLWGLGIGILLLPLALYVGLPILGIAIIVAIFYSAKISSIHDKLETLESEIHKLEISMA
jgi:hypothetical protein